MTAPNAGGPANAATELVMNAMPMCVYIVHGEPMTDFSFLSVFRTKNNAYTYPGGSITHECERDGILRSSSKDAFEKEEARVS